MPYYEQGTLYNAFNGAGHYSDPPNATVQSTGVQTLWCPSDPSVSQISFQDFTYGMRFTSYKGNAGTWFTPGRYQDPTCMGSAFGTLTAQANGLFNFYSNYTMASVTDGTSNTFLLGEFAYGKVNSGDQACWAWWDSGNYADSMFCTLYPLNPFNKVGDLGTGAAINADLYVSAASSFHPGGANFAMADGSVRYVKDSIQQPPINPTTSLPINITVCIGQRLHDHGPAGGLPGPLDPQRRGGHQRRSVLRARPGLFRVLRCSVGSMLRTHIQRRAESASTEGGIRRA